MIKRVIAFVDGENLVMRYQDMLKSSYKPRPSVVHIQDRFVWAPGITEWTRMDMIRVNYYTCVVGEQDEVESTAQAIGATLFRCRGEIYMEGSARILPHVHKKPAKSRKAKVVDIHLTVDAMRATLAMPIDGVLLVSGDGDYGELLAEIGRSGKQAYLAAFSSGLDSSMKKRVEQFVDLDGVFFEPV